MFMSDEMYKKISAKFLEEEGCFKGKLRYDDEDEKFYLNSSEFVSAEVSGLGSSDVDELDKGFESDIRKGVDVLVDGELTQYEDREGRKFLLHKIGTIYSLE